MLPSSTLLTTKLYRPPAATNRVARPALLVRLNDGLSHKLILLSAPPGFGKTTLVNQWLASCALPSAWLALDEGDNDVAHFLRYFVAAVQTCSPTACPTTQNLLSAANLPSVDYLADVMVRELTALTTSLILVLDHVGLHLRLMEITIPLILTKFGMQERNKRVQVGKPTLFTGICALDANHPCRAAVILHPPKAYYE